MACRVCVLAHTNAERNTKHQTPSSREVPESKHQKPSSKHQRNPKFQAPNRGPRFELGVWSFSGVWSLVFGVWDLVLLWSLSPGLSPSQKLISARARPGASDHYHRKVLGSDRGCAEHEPQRLRRGVYLGINSPP